MEESKLPLIVQSFLFFLIGIIIGIFATLLFFRMDKSWKKVLLGVGSSFSAGGIGFFLIEYLNIDSNDVSVVIIMFLLGLIISVYLFFLKLCNLLKEQSGKNVIRILDIILGYEGFLKDYYESRKENINKSIELQKIEDNMKKIDNEKEYLKEIKNKIDIQKKDLLLLELPEKKEVPLTNSFIKKIPLFVNHICKFVCNVEKLTLDFCEKFGEDKKKNAELLKGYFVGIGMYVANDLFGTTNEDVRTHFRVLKDNKYTQYTVVLGSKISDDILSDIPKGKSMIDKSYELKKSLVASLNPESCYDTNTIWEDYLTVTYYNIIKDECPFLSMGISIKYAEQFREMLYFINFYRIEECLHTYIKKIDDACGIIDTLQ